MNQLSLITLILILFVGLSCARNEDALEDYMVAGDRSGIDTNGPSVLKIIPENNSSSVAINPDISITFSEAINKN